MTAAEVAGCPSWCDQPAGHAWERTNGGEPIRDHTLTIGHAAEVGLAGESITVTVVAEESRIGGALFLGPPLVGVFVGCEVAWMEPAECDGLAGLLQQAAAVVRREVQR